MGVVMVLWTCVAQRQLSPLALIGRALNPVAFAVGNSVPLQHERQ